MSESVAFAVAVQTQGVISRHSAISTNLPTQKYGRIVPSFFCFPNTTMERKEHLFFTATACISISLISCISFLHSFHIFFLLDVKRFDTNTIHDAGLAG